MTIKRINSTERHLVVELFDKYRVFYGQPSNKILAENFIRQRLENGESVIFVALHEDNGIQKAAGFTQLYPTYSSVRVAKHWILNDLYVEEDHRQKGLGEKLIRAAIEFARNEGAGYVQLETAVDNHQARRLYEAIGFVRQEPDTDFLLYRLSL